MLSAAPVRRATISELGRVVRVESCRGVPTANRCRESAFHRLDVKTQLDSRQGQLTAESSTAADCNSV
jgi:hypothetical protein